MFKKSPLLMVLLLSLSLCASSRADLVGYWKMDDGAGTTVLDSSEYAVNATIAPENAAVVRWTADGYKGGALEFLIADNLTTLVDAPTMFNLGDSSYSFWMNMPNVFQAWGPIIVLSGGSVDHDIECDGAADLYVNAQGGGVWFGTKNAALNDNQWHHVAVTYNTSSSNKITIYIDGKSAATSTSTIGDSIANVRIGGPRQSGRSQWRRYIGKLDEAAVWSNVLSADDVKNVFWIGPQWMSYATHPSPANAEILGSTTVTLTWTPGTTAARHHVYLGENMEDVKNGTGGTDQGITQAASFSNHPWQLGKTYYWRVDEIEADGTTAYAGAIWSFTISAKLASNPSPADGAVIVEPNTPLTWIPGSGAVSHDVYLGTNQTNLPSVSKGQTDALYTPTTHLAFATTYYWRVDEFDGTNTTTGLLWRFKTRPNFQITDPNLTGYWNFDQDEGQLALDWSGYGNHGSVYGDPARATGYKLGAVTFDGIDDVVKVPQVISREAASNMTLMAWLKADVPGASGTTAREGSGLLWSDHAGGGDHFIVAVLGTKLAFETGPGGNPNTISNHDVVTGDWVHVTVTRTDASQCEVFLNGALDASGDHSGDTRVGSNPFIEIGGNILDGRFFKGMIDEVKAFNRVLSQEEIAQAMRANKELAWNPKPFNGGFVDIRNSLLLSWSAGDGAVEHEVFFGTDLETVNNADSEGGAAYRGRQTATAYSPPDKLQWAQTYYWRIDEVMGNGSTIKGPIWSLSVADYFIVDDFEGYEDLCNRIYWSWIDGAGHWGSPDCGVDPASGTGNNSTVGNQIEPFAERTVVYSGQQSMPLGYDNSRSPFYSETVREWATPQSLKEGGVNTLRIALRGEAAAFAETSPGAFIMNGTGTDIWGYADELRFAYRQLTGNGSITARIDSVSNVNNGAKAGVMIRETLMPESVHTFVDITPGAGAEFIRRLVTADVSTSAVQTGINAPYWVKLTRSGNTFTAQLSADGVTWTSVGTDPAASSVTLPMASNVYIGLAVTSRVAIGVCVARFSNVSTTGTVTGQWLTADVGITQVPGNAPDTFTVAMQDSSGMIQRVSHPDPFVICTGSWELWNLPLSSFTSAGVNMSSIKKMMIRVGNPNTPTAGGMGTLYIDDIRVLQAANP